MSPNNIFCKKCNESFKSLTNFDHHICPKEDEAPKWNNKIGSHRHSDEKHWKKWLDKHYIEQEEQRKKKKSRPVYKKNYKRK